VATTTPLAPPRILATAARILAASSAGGELFLPDGLDASALERLLRALDGWRCDVVGDRLSWMPPANPWSSRLAARVLVHLARVIEARTVRSHRQPRREPGPPGAHDAAIDAGVGLLAAGARSGHRGALTR